MKEVKVVFCILRFRDELLLVRRSKDVMPYNERWETIMEFPEDDVDLKELAFMTIEKQTGLTKNDIELVRIAGPFVWTEEYEKLEITAFLFNTATNKIQLPKGWEYKWVKQDEIDKFYITPSLMEAYKKLSII